MSDVQEFGPAMSVLTEKQRRFVLAMVENPGISVAQAARQAGYSDKSEGAKVSGFYCAHNPAVQAAIREEAGKRLHAGTLIAAGVVIDILTDGDASRKDRLKAAAMLLDRTGFAAAQNINVHQTVKDESGKALMERIERAAAVLGVDPAQLLGLAPLKVIQQTAIEEKTP